MIGLNSPSDVINLPAHEKMAWEHKYKGQFECIFPAEDANRYLPCFPVPRYAEIAALPHVLSGAISPDINSLALTPEEENEFIFEDSLAVFSQTSNNHNSDNSNNFLLPNDVASWIWLKNSEGLSPTDIAHSLAEVQEQPHMLEHLPNPLKKNLMNWLISGTHRLDYPRPLY